MAVFFATCDVMEFKRPTCRLLRSFIGSCDCPICEVARECCPSSPAPTVAVAAAVGGFCSASGESPLAIDLKVPMPPASAVCQVPTNAAVSGVLRGDNSLDRKVEVADAVGSSYLERMQKFQDGFRDSKAGATWNQR